MMSIPSVIEVAKPLLDVTGSDLMVPLLDGSQSRYVNLDYAASAPALGVVADRVTEALGLYASVHRGAGYASDISTTAYENARDTVARFVGAPAGYPVIFTRNTTDSLNLLASAVPGDTLVLDIEHHANFLPWSPRGRRVLTALDTLDETLEALENELRRQPAALVAVTGASNVTGEVLPLRRIADVVHKFGTRLAVDGAQLVPHRRVNMREQGIDYLAFSGHKTYAPFGAGVLVGRRDWLDKAEPYLRGGGAVTTVDTEQQGWRTGPHRHEGGSPNVLGVIGLARAVEALAELDPSEWYQHEAELREACISGLGQIPQARVLQIFSDSEAPVGVVSFSLDGVDSRHLAVVLAAEYGIGVRDGKFCAHPLLARLQQTSPALRVSFGVGSTKRDVTALLTALTDYLAHGPRGLYERVDDNWVVVNDVRDRPSWAQLPDEDREYFGCAG
ncbi:aminotransferase class V-fold PLP-dependent enzyme [Lysinibacter cavernae]|uniref:Selenocysteine lyase/cysteine desulfurase n=1 Tax=Lysinibacter cavernae TaxID=1640652 RepID=A0A7X5R1U9_9MICO|nr:aminotransferase class V-fold PLP-dependent enzyme [Lysinibacter cavernae]NIH54061.1 selenocysteine lyase/cysteine desulfurase [Lysinibacter cavernae]NIH55263.1 selenocysteine lyase/cysteine desulfurase [Lysinibacter cavernae]